MTTALLAGGALAQTNGTFLLTSSNTVSPNSPTTTIEIWATWVNPGAAIVFGAADFDLTAGDGVFLNPNSLLNASFSGMIAGNVISGATMGQLVTGACCPWFMNWDNPILLATYDWTTADFTPREVDLHTSDTRYFRLWFPNTQQVVDLYPDEFMPGSGVIIVEGSCYADCDGSGVLDLFDFLCFQNSFVNGESYACDCDITTGTNPPVCDIFDFLCFQNAFVAGCP